MNDLSIWGMFQKETAQKKKEIDSTNGLTDEQLLIGLSVLNGNVKKLAERLNIDAGALRRRVNGNPMLKECLDSVMTNEIETMRELYNSALLRGEIQTTITTLTEDGKVDSTKTVMQKIEARDRLYHMMRTLEKQGKTLGIQEPVEPTSLNQTNIQINVYNEKKQNALDQLIEILESDEDTSATVVEGD